MNNIRNYTSPSKGKQQSKTPSKQSCDNETSTIALPPSPPQSQTTPTPSPIDGAGVLLPSPTPPVTTPTSASSLRPTSILNKIGLVEAKDKKAAEAFAAKKKALEAIKETPQQQILKHSPRAVTLAPKERETLLRKWGEKVYKIEEEAFSLFNSLDCHHTDGQLRQAEFKSCLGAMGMISSAFPEVVFSSIDTEGSGSISFYEYFSWLLTMQHGTYEEKLLYGFSLCDQNHDGCIDKTDLTKTIENMFKVLTGLHLEGAEMDVGRFVDTVFTKFGQQESGKINWHVFQANVKNVETFLRTLGSRKTSCYRSPSVKKGGPIIFGSNKWNFIVSMMLGLEYAVRGINQMSEQEILDEESTRDSEVGSVTDGESGGTGGSDNTSYIDYQKDSSTKSVSKDIFQIPTNDSTKCRIVAYGSAQFHTIRQACRISDDDFLLSVGIRQVIGSLLLGDLFGLSEQISEGKSGSMFYWSNDGRYMIKSISRAESYTMRKILMSYRQHMVQFPENLLMRILGLYRLKINSDKWDIIVISNVFDSSLGIHERFDLKGSTYERTVGLWKRCMPGVVMKDKDFLEMGRKIRVGPELAERLKAQIRLDTGFLAKNDIIDYSFLLGVHYVDRGVPEDVWISSKKEELQKIYVKFQEIQGEFFEKDFDFERFAHYAYIHQHFDNPTMKQGGAAGGAGAGTGGLLGGASMPRDSSDNFLNLAESSGNRSGSSLSLASPPTTGGGGGGSNIIMNPRKGIKAYKTDEDADEPDQILFFSIIDMLVPFDSKKKGEYVLKSMYHRGGQTFSVIPPKDYSERFHAFMTNAIR